MHDHAACDNKTDEELVEMALRNRDFFGCIITRYEPKLTRYIRRISHFSPEDIEDLLQEVFLKAYTNLRSFDPKLKFSSWIYRIAHNHTISSFRKSKTRPQTVQSEANDLILANVTDDFDIKEQLDLEYVRNNIDSVLAKMDVKYREVLIFRYFEEKEYQEISDILRKPVGTVGTLLNRAKKQFLKIIEQQKVELS